MPHDEQQLTHHFTDMTELNNAVMPFVQDGGIFIPTDNEFHLGDRVLVNIILPQNEQPFALKGEVIWITPKATHSNFHRPGIGIHCGGDEGIAFQKAVQTLLADFKEDPTPDTM